MSTETETLTATKPSFLSTFFGQTMFFFGLTLLAAVGGIFGGIYFLPPALISSLGFMLAMLAITLILVFTARKWSRSDFGYLVLIAFSAIFGLTMVPLLAYAVSVGGALILGKALFATVAMFVGMAIYGATTSRDLSGLGGFLMASLIGMILVSLLTFVLSLFGVNVWSSTAEIVFAGFGILLFAGFTMYDFQQIKRLAGSITPIEAAIKLFLDFILLFQYILHFMTALGRD